MKAPESLQALIDYGIIEEVVRPLMSGKEAQVYVVLAQGQECVAKVYKEAIQRNFKQRIEYTEGRRTRNSRDQRAVNKRSKHGRRQDEAAWRNTEVDMIYRLRDAGVRVPEPINFVDGVLVMELVKDGDGDPAPRLGDLAFSADEAEAIYEKLIREVVRMLCAGVVHGDLSEFNVLMASDGPVVIDFPQSVDPANNQSARKLLLRDVENLHRFVARASPGRRAKPLGEEIWALFESNDLQPDTELSGKFAKAEGKADTEEVLALIGDAEYDEMKRRGEGVRDDDDDDFESVMTSPRPRRVVVDFTPAQKKRPAAKKGARPKRGRKPARGGAVASHAAAATHESTAEGTPAAKKRRSRRRRGSAAAQGDEAKQGAQRPEEKAPASTDGKGTRKRSRRRRTSRGPKAAASKTESPMAGRHSDKGASAGQASKTRPGESSDKPRPARRRRRRPAAARRPE